MRRIIAHSQQGDLGQVAELAKNSVARLFSAGVADLRKLRLEAARGSFSIKVKSSRAQLLITNKILFIVQRAAA
jgi:hypothetical protein